MLFLNVRSCRIVVSYLKILSMDPVVEEFIYGESTKSAHSYTGWSLVTPHGLLIHEIYQTKNEDSILSSS